MNKTLLLIICDFLLLNLLALTRWEEPPEAPPDNALSSPAETVQQVVQEDLVGALRMTLEEERQAREALNQQLSQTQTELTQREESIAEREARLAALRENLQRKEQEAARLHERVNDTQQAVSQLSASLTEATQRAASSKSQAEQLAKELEERQRAAAEMARQMQELEQQRAKAAQEIQSLNTQMQVAETERTFLRESVDTLRTQVGAEREEKARLQEQTGRLAEGVTQLAENTGNLRQEIRSNTPINANTLFNDFLTNRVDAAFQGQKQGLFGTLTYSPPPAKTILVTDGTNTFAIFHTRQTPVSEGVADWRTLSGQLKGSANAAPIERLQMLVIDPRVAVAPIDPAQVQTMNVRAYPTALEPFKFPEAVLISQGGRAYGEVEFKLDPQTPGYVKMTTRVFTRLFGEFSPSAGDVVLSKTGEILGIMVNDTYCRLIDNFTPRSELPLGPDLAGRKTSDILAANRDRILGLPLRLQ